MKKIGISLLFCLVAIFSVLFSYYMTKETVKDTLTVEDVYTVAQREGYSGTLAEFASTLRGASGNDGRGISDAHINSSGHLIITYTDGESVDLGKIAAGSVNVFEDISGESIHAALTSSVSIIATMSDGKYSFGSGIIYKLDKSRGEAYILTNYHVVYDRYIGKRAPDGKLSAYLYGMEYTMYEIELEYVGGSSAYDIAVLKVTDSDVIRESGATEAKIADSDMVSVLDYAVAVGNPSGMGLSATEGKVSVESENKYINTGASGGDVFMRVIRTDAAINKGNSGGGLFDSKGRLIGVVCAIESTAGVENISYAIPSNIAVSVAENILYYCDNSASEYGYTYKLGIGLYVSSASVEYDDTLDKTVKREVVKIKSIAPGSYAEQAGLLVEDTVLSVSIDGEVTQVSRVHMAPEATLDAREGSVIVYEVERDGAILEFTIICSDEFVKIQ